MVSKHSIGLLNGKKSLARIVLKLQNNSNVTATLSVSGVSEEFRTEQFYLRL